jgi:hypothetical protein
MPFRLGLRGFEATLALVLAGLAALSCDNGDTSEPAEIVAERPGNLLANPGFEAGREGWSYPTYSKYWKDFEIAEAGARTGQRAARLRLERDPSSRPRRTEISGVVQELRPEAFPERLGGWYRVQRWEKESEPTDLYLQVVVIVWDDPRIGTIVRPERPVKGLRNYQMRYYLAGLEEPPFRLVNARLEFVDKGPPKLGVWTHFEVPLRSDFERLWGVVPEGYDRLRILFEARWDNMPAEASVHADVYYDDLYLDYGAAPG